MTSSELDGLLKHNEEFRKMRKDMEDKAKKGLTNLK